MRSVGAALVKLIATATSGLVSFTTNVIRPVKVTCEFSPVQEGTGDPSPNNVRPISGWTGCSVFQAQKNLFNKKAQPYRAGGYINEFAQVGENLTSRITNNANYNIYALPVKPGQNYVFGYIGASQPRMVAIDHNQKILGVYDREGNGYRNCLTPDSAEYLLFSVAIAGAYKNIDDFQVELGSVHSTYEAYHGAEIPITFTDPSTGDPLTVYGGTVTLNEDGSADVVANKAKITYVGNASESWSKFGSGSASAFAMKHPLSNFINTNGAIIADYLVTIEKDASWGSYDNWVSWANPNVLVTGIKSITTVAAWKAYLAENPLTIVYNLRSTLSYHLDNVGQLQSFLGTNNIWHNMNGGITVEYWNKQ